MTILPYMEFELLKACPIVCLVIEKLFVEGFINTFAWILRAGVVSCWFRTWIVTQDINHIIVLFLSKLL